MAEMDWSEREDNLTFRLLREEWTRRLRELVVYISDRCHDDPKFGLTKLNKILFHSDFRCFARLGKPITGDRYVRQEFGPVPGSIETMRDNMVRDGDIVIRKVMYGGRDQQRPTPLREADTSLFSERELQIVSEVIGELWNKSATEVSNDSHGIAWKTRPAFTDIPYEAAYLSDEPITKDDLARTEELALELGWERA